MTQEDERLLFDMEGEWGAMADPAYRPGPQFTLTEDVWERVRHIGANRDHKRLVGRKGGRIPMKEAERLGLVQTPQPEVETQERKRGDVETQDVAPPKRGRRKR